MFDSEPLRVHAFLSDGAGGVSNAFSDISDWALTARSDLKLAGDWGDWGDFSAAEGGSLAAFLGGAIHYQEGESGDLPAVMNDVDVRGWTLDGSFEYRGFHFFAATFRFLGSAGCVVEDCRFRSFAASRRMLGVS